MHPLRSHQSYLAALGHRLSGVALAIFLPLHFLLLGSAINGAERLDHFLAFADQPLVKFAEWGLVVFLGVHLAFGIRVLRLELTQWPHRGERLMRWILPSLALSLAAGVLFLYRAFS